QYNRSCQITHQLAFYSLSYLIIYSVMKFLFHYLPKIVYLQSSCCHQEKEKRSDDIKHEAF
ncbi:hypothetical protein LOS09_05995, partial [Proteus mirabilis]|uniref:hypothetical protein n=1 Tax=Proteus mirabilis TaxID=584 RepID=UPI001E3BAC7B